jgi:protein O-GlcNAc transferase
MKQRMAGQYASRVAAAFQQAVLLQQQGRPFQAEAVCAQVLQADPRHHGAWHLRGLLALENGQTEQGVEWIEKSLKIQPNQFAAHSNIGNALLSGSQPEQALVRFERALRLKPDYIPALYNKGNALRDLRRFEEALASYDKLLRLNGDHVQALNNRGLVLLELHRADEALIACRRATELDSRYVGAHENTGAILLKLERKEEALECYDCLLQWAPREVNAWTGRGNALRDLKRWDDARASYMRALEIDPLHVDTLVGLGLVLQLLRQPEAALEEYTKALHHAPDSVLALNNSGNTLVELGKPAEALPRYDRALELSPGDANTLYNRASALRELKRYEESANAFAELLRIAPDHDYALGNLFHLQMDCCDWRDYGSLSERLYAALAKNRRVINPLSLLLYDAPELQLSCARTYVEDQCAEDESLGPCIARRGTVGERRLRVAYVSADFCDHPVSHLLVGVLEQHDRSGFEVVGVSLHTGDGGQFERRVRGAFDRFIEVTDRTDREVAQLLRDMEVDVAVDLMGFTQAMRLGIFAYRCAPVQVSYLGYAGTSGAPYMDYLLADEVVVPAAQKHHYTERVVRLSHCYLPNDDRREIALIPTRVEAGLPQDAFVFCAFTSAHKLNPTVFDIWMRLLQAVPGSVLWLRSTSAEARRNLQREAQARGVDPQRLVFAPHVPSMAAHLARHSLADLYLDTLPYNAHSTTCDALWAGVPVLTCAGQGFASRVAASALTAVGLPELITDSLPEYERKALELAREPPHLQALRSKLAGQRTGSPLFDTARYCRDLEAAYRTVHERALRGEAPIGFDVAR